MTKASAAQANPPADIIMVDFSAARTPKSDFAKALAENAATKLAKGGSQREMASSRFEAARINPYLLGVIEDFNSRDMSMPENIAHVDELAQSIAKVGVKNPLAIIWEKGKPYVTDGHCRLLAVFRAIEHYGAQIQDVPTIPEDRNLSKGDLYAVQITRNGSKKLSPLEMAVLYKKMRAEGMTEAAIADKVHKTAAHVSSTITLLEIISEDSRIENLVRQGRISPNFAKQTIEANEGNHDAAFSVLDAAVDEALAEAEEKGVEDTEAKPVKAMPRHARKVVGQEDEPPAKAETKTDTPAEKAGKGSKSKTKTVAHSDRDEVLTVAAGYLEEYREKLKAMLPETKFNTVAKMLDMILGEPA